MESIDSVWLNALQVGQEWITVLHYRGRKGGRIVSVKVSRRTPTQIVVMLGGEERRYRAKDGVRVGSETWAIIPTPASLETIDATRQENLLLNMAAQLKACNFENLPYETVKAMFKLLPANQHEKEDKHACP